jgi:hypothetical protein
VATLEHGNCFERLYGPLLSSGTFDGET